MSAKKIDPQKMIEMALQASFDGDTQLSHDLIERMDHECDQCALTFEEWEPEPGFQQPPQMPSGMFCRPCWDEVAEKRAARS